MAEAPVWVLDTNVLVSGLLSPFGPPGRLVDALLARRLRLAFDDRIELEYREILARPRFGISQAWQDAFSHFCNSRNMLPHYHGRTEPRLTWMTRYS